jgi:hypothetical protein
MSQPLWFTVPLIAAYAALWGYFVYILLRYRKRS